MLQCILPNYSKSLYWSHGLPSFFPNFILKLRITRKRAKWERRVHVCLHIEKFFFFCCTSGSDGCYSPESCVFDDVFADYNTRVRPASTPGEVIHINVTITVTSLIGIVNSVYAFLGNCTSRFKRHNTFGMSKNIWAYLRKNLASSPTRIPAWIKPCDVSLGFTWFSGRTQWSDDLGRLPHSGKLQQVKNHPTVHTEHADYRNLRCASSDCVNVTPKQHNYTRTLHHSLAALLSHDSAHNVCCMIKLCPTDLAWQVLELGSTTI